MRYNDITNQNFGKLTAIKRIGTNKSRCSIWQCQCECGNTTNVLYSNLISGSTRSCGCDRKHHITKDSRSYTLFGEQMRILRVQNHEKMEDIAKDIGVTVSMLSAVETGQRTLPLSWIPRIASHYHLDDDQTEKLMEDAKKTRESYFMEKGNIRTREHIHREDLKRNE